MISISLLSERWHVSVMDIIQAYNISDSGEAHKIFHCKVKDPTHPTTEVSFSHILHAQFIIKILLLFSDDAPNIEIIISN